jgi:hypothetical protein
VTNPNNTEAKIKIRNCVFGFRCAQNWEAMDETSRNDVRFCRECAKDVYYVENHIELSEAIGLNRCVAIKPASNEENPAKDGLGMILGMVRSYEEIHNEPEPNAAFRKRMRDKKIT